MLDKRNPSAGDAGAGSLEVGQRSEAKHNRRRRARQGAVAVIWHDSGFRKVTVKGRDLWALRQLMAAGAEGVTAISNPAPRWSAYVHNLRALCFEISTEHEGHGGPFAGHHARYRLHGHVELEPLVDVDGGQP